MKKQFLEIGQIVAPQGIKGEVRVDPWSDNPDFLLDLEFVFFDQGNKKVVIEMSRVQKNIVVLKLEGIDTIEQAQKLRNQVLFLDRDDIELDENVYFVQDLIGLKVIDFDDKNKVYGEIIDVTQTGANDVYHIKAENGKINLIPAIAKIVIKTDIENRVMEITPLEGLFDDED